MSQGDAGQRVRPYDFWWRSPLLRRHPGDLALVVAAGWHLALGVGIGRAVVVRPAEQGGFGLGILLVFVVLPVLAVSLVISVLLCRRSVGAGPAELVWRGTWATAVGLVVAVLLATAYVVLQGSG